MKVQQRCSYALTGCHPDAHFSYYTELVPRTALTVDDDLLKAAEKAMAPQWAKWEDSHRFDSNKDEYIESYRFIKVARYLLEVVLQDAPWALDLGDCAPRVYSHGFFSTPKFQEWLASDQVTNCKAAAEAVKERTQHMVGQLQQATQLQLQQFVRLDSCSKSPYIFQGQIFHPAFNHFNCALLVTPNYVVNIRLSFPTCV